MKNTCSQYLFLFLLSLSTSPPPPVEASIARHRWVRLDMIPYGVGMTWDDANDYCRSDNGGKGQLAIARNDLDVQYLSEVCRNSVWTCWVGLRFREDGEWRWNNGQKSSLLDTTGQASGKRCGTVKGGQLVDNPCDTMLYFLCENNTLALVEEEKTWEEALHHCRGLAPYASDLLSFHDEEELSYAQDEMARAQTEEVWIGLRWLAGRWLWMDRTAGGTISLAECPANGTHCGTLSGGGQHARNCMEKRRFFCLK